jgi:hypothetical protein
VRAISRSTVVRNWFTEHAQCGRGRGVQILLEPVSGIGSSQFESGANDNLLILPPKKFFLFVDQTTFGLAFRRFQRISLIKFD